MPVLERLEPELRSQDVGPACGVLCSARHRLLGVVGPAAGCGMKYERGEEQGEQRERQRSPVDRQRPTPVSNRPRSIGVVSMSLRIFVDVGCALERLGLGRAPLSELDRQHDEHRHLQKLRLPVLERCFTEVRRRQVPRPTDRRHAGVDTLLVVDVKSSRGLTDEPNEKERCNQHKPERVASNKLLHSCVHVATMPVTKRLGTSKSR